MKLPSAYPQATGKILIRFHYQTCVDPEFFVNGVEAQLTEKNSDSFFSPLLIFQRTSNGYFKENYNLPGFLGGGPTFSREGLTVYMGGGTIVFFPIKTFRYCVFPKRGPELLSSSLDLRMSEPTALSSIEFPTREHMVDSRKNESSKVVSLRTFRCTQVVLYTKLFVSIPSFRNSIMSVSESRTYRL